MIDCSNSSWDQSPDCVCEGAGLRWHKQEVFYAISDAYSDHQKSLVRAVFDLTAAHTRCLKLTEIFDLNTADIPLRFRQIDGAGQTLAETQAFFTGDRMVLAEINVDVGEPTLQTDGDFFTAIWHELLHALGILDHAPEGSDNLLAPEQSDPRTELGMWDLAELMMRYCESPTVVA